MKRHMNGVTHSSSYTGLETILIIVFLCDAYAWMLINIMLTSFDTFPLNTDYV